MACISSSGAYSISIVALILIIEVFQQNDKRKLSASFQASNFVHCAILGVPT